MFFLYGCACLSFSDLLAYGYAVMMLNVLRSDITIKILTLTSKHIYIVDHYNLIEFSAIPTTRTLVELIKKQHIC